MSSDSNRIEILGSLDGGEYYTETMIVDLLGSDQIGLSRGTNFIGRPGTRIHCQDGHVLKLREDIAVVPNMAARWLREHDIEREKRFNVHHPHKTWFLHYCDGDVVAGNVTPQLQPLHTALKESSDSDWCIEQLAALTDLYARTVSEHKYRLDEGLSNFGLDGDGKLFYIDDEFYRWDRFVGFTQGLGLYMRSLDQLNAAAAGRLGTMVAEIWVRHYRDPNCPYAIARLVRDIPLAASEQRDRRDAMVMTLEGVTRKARKARKASVKRVMSAQQIAILADVHANAPALRATLDALKEAGVETGIVLGDVVGYGPHPGECIAMLRDTGFPVLKGNHDHAVATGYTGPGINKAALWAVEWTRAVLSTEELEWLAALPNSLQDEDWFAVHGSPLDPNYFYGYVYRTTAAKNLDYLQNKGIRRCFHGHSHMAAVYFRDTEGMDGYDDKDQDLGGQSHSLICPGSIGKTRCGSPGAEFAIYDRQADSLTLQRIDYDLDAALADMTKGEFPEVLIERLQKGM